MRTLLLGGAFVALALAATVAAHDTPPPARHAAVDHATLDRVAVYAVAPANALRMVDLAPESLAMNRQTATQANPATEHSTEPRRAARGATHRLTNLLALRGGRGFL